MNLRHFWRPPIAHPMMKMALGLVPTPRLQHSGKAGLTGRSRGWAEKEQHTCSASARVMGPCGAVNSSRLPRCAVSILSTMSCTWFLSARSNKYSLLCKSAGWGGKALVFIVLVYFLSGVSAQKKRIKVWQGGSNNSHNGESQMTIYNGVH